MSVDTDNRGAKDTSKAPVPLTGVVCLVVVVGWSSCIIFLQQVSFCLLFYIYVTTICKLQFLIHKIRNGFFYMGSFGCHFVSVYLLWTY